MVNYSKQAIEDDFVLASKLSQCLSLHVYVCMYLFVCVRGRDREWEVKWRLLSVSNNPTTRQSDSVWQAATWLSSHCCSHSCSYSCNRFSSTLNHLVGNSIHLINRSSNRASIDTNDSVFVFLFNSPSIVAVTVNTLNLK